MQTRSNVAWERLSPSGWEVAQGESGYRYNEDSFALADFVSPKKQVRFLDVGAGAGILSFLLLQRFPLWKGVALEVQDDLANLAKMSVGRNGLDERLEVLIGDGRNFRKNFQPECFDSVICNPPYYRLGSGRRSPDPGRDLARTAESLTPELIAEIAAFVLKPKGFLWVCLDPVRLGAWMKVLTAKRLELKRMQMVHPGPKGQAHLTLIEARKGGGEGLIVEPPLMR